MEISKDPQKNEFSWIGKAFSAVIDYFYNAISENTKNAPAHIAEQYDSMCHDISDWLKDIPSPPKDISEDIWLDKKITQLSKIIKSYQNRFNGYDSSLTMDPLRLIKIITELSSTIGKENKGILLTNSFQKLVYEKLVELDNFKIPDLYKIFTDEVLQKIFEGDLNFEQKLDYWKSLGNKASQEGERDKVMDIIKKIKARPVVDFETEMLVNLWCTQMGIIDVDLCYRNGPCHCGSGKKYKKCHMPKLEEKEASFSNFHEIEHWKYEIAKVIDRGDIEVVKEKIQKFKALPGVDELTQQLVNLWCTQRDIRELGYSDGPCHCDSRRVYKECHGQLVSK